MGYGFAPAKVTSLIVEDDQKHRLQLVEKLGSSRAFEPLFYDNYRKAPFMRRAKDADIVSLDLEVEHHTNESRYVCKQLKSADPFKTVIYFTSNPEEVLTEPINFVLEKSKDVWDSYDSLLLQIFVHDRSLNLLHDVLKLSADQQDVQEHYNEIREQLPSFISSLLSIQDVFKKENKKTAKRYLKLGKFLTQMYRVSGDEKGISYKLHQMQRPLMGWLNTELAELKQVEGVHVTPKLEDEIRGLVQSVAEQSSSYVDDRTFTEKVIVSAADRVTDTLKSVSEYFSGGNPEPLPLVSDDEDETKDERSLYLNASFPDYEEKETLTVSVPAEMRISLDHVRGDDSLGASEELPAEKAELLQETGQVDVMLLCPEADVHPIIRTLDLPPRKDNYVTFSVTPRVAGQLNLTIVLLLKNEPIHRTAFSCQAVEVITTTVTSYADTVLSLQEVEAAQNEVENY